MWSNTVATVLLFRYSTTQPGLAQGPDSFRAMRILVSGSSGLIGNALTSALASGSHSVVRLVRGSAPPQGASIPGHPARQTIDRSRLEGFAAAGHPAGEPILGRWTTGKK